MRTQDTILWRHSLVNGYWIAEPYVLHGFYSPGFTEAVDEPPLLDTILNGDDTDTRPMDAAQITEALRKSK